ncbi:DUF1330 domain-containing protein [Solidesulfovibrio magneticus]|uniref:DUF1330 domain-containing protein n=1 Tax=Solidesulfovibrio magneticus TaxID=184917 RepID=UPI0002D2A1DC|nr:DUF1330 domain-containing protein [Solidesulfovibrio magneticus]
MPAYLLFIRERLRDQAQYAVYKDTVPAAMQGHDATARAVYGLCETLEGPEAQGVVILEFASMAAARDFYHRPAYQEASRARHLGCDYRVILTEGL